MCNAWKLLGAVTLFGSFLYNCSLITILLTLWTGCRNDCISEISNEVEAYCEEPPVLLPLCLPIPVFAVLIILCDFRNTFYLQLWLGFQLTLMVVSGLCFYTCLHWFTGNSEVVEKLVSMVLSLISFIIIGYHLIKILLSNAEAADRNRSDSNA